MAKALFRGPATGERHARSEALDVSGPYVSVGVRLRPRRPAWESLK
jgi:hypothetical protein